MYICRYVDMYICIYVYRYIVIPPRCSNQWSDIHPARHSSLHFREKHSFFVPAHSLRSARGGRAGDSSVLKLLEWSEDAL